MPPASANKPLPPVDDRRPQSPRCHTFGDIRRKQLVKTLKRLGDGRIHLLLIGVVLGIWVVLSFQGQQFDTPSHAERQSFEGLSILEKHAVTGASHDSAERLNAPRCHPDTCLSILEQLHDWSKGPISNISSPIFWLSGGPGTGKSIIAQTIAEQWDEQGELGATLFFSQITPGLDETTSAVVTIASQLARRFPGYSSHVGKTIEEDPEIFSRSLSDQVQSLVAHPLEDLPTQHSFSIAPKIIILDGVDELVRVDHRRELLDVLGQTIAEHQLPLKFLLTSRGGLQIEEAFARHLLNSSAIHLDLDKQRNNDEDIEVFLRSEFMSIKTSYSWLNNTFWPPSHAIQTLVTRSQGSFAYPAVVMKYLNTPGSNPRHSLDAILKLKSENRERVPDGLAPALDGLYTYILSSLPQQTQDVLLDVLAFWIARAHLGQSALGPSAEADSDITQRSNSRSSSLSHFRKLLLFDEAELEWYLQSVNSLVTSSPAIPNGPGSRQIRPAHRFLLDFLTNPSRSGPFSLTTEDAHGRLARCYLRHLALQMSAAGGHSPILGPWSLQEADDAFQYHLGEAATQTDLRDTILTVLRNNQKAYKAFIMNDGLEHLGVQRTSVRLFDLVSPQTRKSVVVYLQRCNQDLNPPSWPKLFRSFGLQLYQILLYLVFQKQVLPEGLVGAFVTRILLL